MKDLLGNDIANQSVSVNIYADEILGKKSPNKEEWDYIGIVVEDLSEHLLEDIIKERFCNNFDKKSSYYSKNNRIIHWSEISDADTKNICKRWFNYILNADKRQSNFYAFIFGIHYSRLNLTKFDSKNTKYSVYNRFFRSALSYELKTFFPHKQIIVKQVFHEEGGQKNHKYFPWHTIYKLQKEEKNIFFDTHEIQFVGKDHTIDDKANLIQLCDAFMGACVSIIDGIHKSKRSEYREELMKLLLPLVDRMINYPKNKNSHYQYANKIMISFFPKKNQIIDNEKIKKFSSNIFYTNRTLYFKESINGQLFLNFDNI